MKFKSLPELKVLKNYFYYEPETGLFKRKKCTFRTHILNEVVGSKNKRDGYILIPFKSKNYFAHRLAWKFFYNEDPKTIVDHINGIPDDNRIENLRLVTHAENQKNRKISSNNKTGYSGVAKIKGYYHAYIKSNSKIENLGKFKNLEDAIKARKEAEIKYGFITAQKGR